MREGWKIRPLKDLCSDFRNDIVDGPFGANLKREHYKTEGVPVLKIQNIKPFEIVPKNMDYVDEKKALELKRHAYKNGDIIITKLGLPLGISAIAEDIAGGIIVADLVRVRAEKIDTRYLCYHLNAPVTNAFLNAQQGGATRPRVKISAVRELPIHVPPLPEQKRIAAFLDEAFEGIAAAVANAEKNLANARELFESCLQSFFADAWRTCDLVPLTDLTTDITDGDHMPPPKATSGVPFITIRNIDKGTRKIDFSDTFKVPNAYFEDLKSNKKPKFGDVLYTVTGSFGVPVLISENREFCFQRHIGLLRPKSDVDSEWLYYLLMSPQIFKQANEGATGTAQKTVSLKVLRGFQVPRAPLTEQRTIAAKLRFFLQETQILESVYKRKLAALTALKQSLLQKAFAGELTAQPDQALKEAVG